MEFLALLATPLLGALHPRGVRRAALGAGRERRLFLR